MGLFNMYGIPVFSVMNDSPSADDEILPENKTITETSLSIIQRHHKESVLVNQPHTQGLRTSSYKTSVVRLKLDQN